MIALLFGFAALLTPSQWQLVNTDGHHSMAVFVEKASVPDTGDPIHSARMMVVFTQPTVGNTAAVASLQVDCTAHRYRRMEGSSYDRDGKMISHEGVRDWADVGTAGLWSSVERYACTGKSDFPTVLTADDVPVQAALLWLATVN
jgi:hypothetical protein